MNNGIKLMLFFCVISIIWDLQGHICRNRLCIYKDKKFFIYLYNHIYHIYLIYSRYESFLFMMQSRMLKQDFNSSRSLLCMVIYGQILYPTRFSLKNLHMRPINFTLCRQWLSRHSIPECQRYSLHVWTPQTTHRINKKTWPI